MPPFAKPHRVAKLPVLDRLPHPRWLDAGPNAVTIVNKGGVLWVLGTLGAYLLGIPRSERALKELLPSLAATTLIAQYPLKAAFPRRRPFSERMRGLVLGRQRPARSSYPSAHTASTFTAAWVLSATWPRWAPAFFGLASASGLNRWYVGAHHPSDVAAGALWGVVLAELSRWASRRLLG